MDITVIHAEKEPVEYPCLMMGKVTKRVYFMLERGKGVLILGEGKPVGSLVEHLEMSQMKPFRGTVTLES